MHYSDFRENLKESTKLWTSFESAVPVFQKSFASRSDDENNKIFNLFLEIPHLRNHINKQPDRTEALLELSRAFRHEIYPEYQAFHHQGTIPQKFSLIIKGDIKRFVHKSATEIENEKTSLNPSSSIKESPSKIKKPIDEEANSLEYHIFKGFDMDKKYFNHEVLTFKQKKIFNPGDYIGDLPIVFNSPYDDTLITWSEVHVVSIEKKEYKRIFEKFIKDTQEKILFFEQTFPTEYREALVNIGYAANRRVLNTPDKVFQQGTNSDEVYFIRQGEVELWGSIRPNDAKESGDKAICKLSKLDKKAKESRKNLRVSVVLLSQGQIFGEECILGLNERTLTALVKSLNTVIYEVPKTIISKLSQHYPEFVSYLTAQAKVSFEAKITRYSNLEKGVEKTDLGKASSPLKVRRDGIASQNPKFEEEKETLTKEIMDLYVVNAVEEKERDGSQRIYESIRSKGMDDKAGLSPDLKKVYQKMAELKTSMVHGKVRVDTKLIAEAREDESKQREDSAVLYHNIEGVESEKKHYFPQTLWIHAKQTHKEKSKRIKKEKLERDLLEKIYESTRAEDTKNQSQENLIQNKAINRKLHKSQEKYTPFRQLKQNTVRPDHSERIDSQNDTDQAARKDNVNKLNSQSKIRLAQFYNENFKEDIGKKKNIDISLRSHLDQIFSSPKIETNELQITKVETSISSFSRIDKKVHSEIYRTSIANLEAKPQLTPANTGSDEERKLARYKSYSPKKFQRSEIGLETPTSIGGRDLRKESTLANIFSRDMNKPNRTALYENSEEDEIKESFSAEKKIILPKVVNKKLESSKHNMFRLKPAYDNLARGNHKIFL